MLRLILKGIATGAGSGLLPLAPGTWGSMMGILLAWLLSPLSAVMYVITTVGVIFIAIWSAGEARHLFGGGDPPQVVIDEIAAMLLVMAFQPFSWMSVIVGFLAFRVFDVWKPWPVRQCEALSGGIGIVMDDLMAGIYAWLLLRAVLSFAG